MGDMVDELELYVRHGMTPLAALASATTVTAELFGLEATSVSSRRARSPICWWSTATRSNSIGAFRDPVQVFRAGRPVFEWPRP